MDAYTCIRTKRDTRGYDDRPISEESLERILQAGRMSGSSKDTQPWRFIVLQQEGRKRELVPCGKFAEHIASAPLVVAIVQPEGAREFDAGRCAQNMMLAAWAEGITSCLVAMHDQGCALNVLGVPGGHRIPIVLAFGYPPSQGRETLGRRRTPLEELVHREGW
jgi:nitroreductase